MRLILDGKQMTTKQEAIAYLKTSFGIEHCQGNTLDALWDSLSERRPKEPIEILVINKDRLTDELGKYGERILNFLNQLPKLHPNYQLVK